MTEAMHLILIVEDDEAIQSVLRMLFEAHGFRVVIAATAAMGLHDARLYKPDIALVDLGLPDRDGIDVISGIRTWSPMPIIVLTARTAEAQRLDLPKAVLQLGDVSIDLAARIARRQDGSEVRLTPLEHRILETLARHADRIVTHASLLKEVWGPDRDDSRSLRVYIGNLRRKLEADPGRPKHIITELGLGYRLVIDPSHEVDPARGGLTVLKPL
jgi:two-component system KDP operon response regulator KdpE